MLVRTAVCGTGQGHLYFTVNWIEDRDCHEPGVAGRCSSDNDLYFFLDGQRWPSSGDSNNNDRVDVGHRFALGCKTPEELSFDFALHEAGDGPDDLLGDHEETLTGAESVAAGETREWNSREVNMGNNASQSVSQGFICEIINKRANTCDPTIEEYVYSSRSSMIWCLCML